MKYLYHLSQNIYSDYDFYSDIVVCAKNPIRAKLIHPEGNCIWVNELDENGFNEIGWYQKDKEGKPIPDSILWDCWCNPKSVRLKWLGEAFEGIKEDTVICASFHAG